MITEPWTEEEKRVLSDNYQFLNNKQLTALLPGRTLAAIRSKLVQMGLVYDGRRRLAFRKKQYPELSESQKSYFAGYFDGKGCINITFNSRYPQVIITVTVLYKPILERYCEYFGGRLQLAGKVKQSWIWTLRSYFQVLRFIDAILPFSMEKREQLEVVHPYLVKYTDQKIGIQAPSF